jgi:hypothetical protein
MDIKKLFGTDQKLEATGVWVDLGQGARVKVARATSPAYRKRLQDVIRPYRGAITANAMDDREAHKLFAKAAAGTLLLDWAGIEVDGRPVQFSLDVAEQLMAELPDFYNTVKAFADDAALYREQHEADEQKN